MLRSRVKHIVLSSTQNATKLQAVADMLLLTDNTWPVIYGNSGCDQYAKYKEDVRIKVHEFVVLINQIQEGLISLSPSLEELSTCLDKTLVAVVELIELSAHLSYLLVELFPNCNNSIPGVIDLIRVRKILLDLKMLGHLLKISSHEHLSPPVLVQIASNLNDALSRLTKYCTTACDTVAGDLDREQLRSCVKSMSAAGSNVMTSIRVFKASPNELHQARCVFFFDALLATVNATISFITEPYFIGKPAVLSKNALDRRKKILGACMNVVSSCVQLYNSIKEYAYDTKNPFLRERVVKCTDAICQATGPLLEAIDIGAAKEFK